METATATPHWLDSLALRGACDHARAWARTQPDYATAWAACNRPDWIRWTLSSVDGISGDFHTAYNLSYHVHEWTYSAAIAPARDALRRALVSGDEGEVGRAHLALDAARTAAYALADAAACNALRFYFPDPPSLTPPPLP